MTVMSQQQVIDRDWRSSTLYDVIELILDKGMVIDVYLRVSLVGIELLTVDARIVVASVDTYLQFAERVHRVDLVETKSSRTLPEMFGELSEQGSRGKSKGALSGAASAFTEAFHRGRGGNGEAQESEQERPRRQERHPEGRQR
ncbi:MAG TPA: gas vesicle structural protein GvpA [Mycobacteriales bacterium]